MLRKKRKHHIKTDTYSQLVALVWCHRMCQVDWKHQKHPVAHRHHDLICILGREFSNWRSDDAGLRPWIVKVNRICSRMRMNIVYATQEIVRVL